MQENKINNIVEKIQEAADAAGAQYYDDYSGRFMYGDCCPGVVGDIYTLMEVLANLSPNLRKTFKQDSMGQKYIYYWPGIVTKKREE